jgi:hypothetical protein
MSGPEREGASEVERALDRLIHEAASGNEYDNRSNVAKAKSRVLALLRHHQGEAVQGWTLPLSKADEAADLGWIVTRVPSERGEIPCTLILYAQPQEAEHACPHGVSRKAGGPFCKECDVW